MLASCFHSLLGQSLTCSRVSGKCEWRCSGPHHTRTTKKGLAWAGQHTPTVPVATSKQPKQGGTAAGFPGSSCSGRLQELLRHPYSAMQSQFARVVKGADLRSTACKCALSMLASFLTACWAKSHKIYKEGLGIRWATRSYTSSGTLQAAQARRDRHWLPWLFLLWQTARVTATSMFCNAESVCPSG